MINSTTFMSKEILVKDTGGIFSYVTRSYEEIGKYYTRVNQEGTTKCMFYVDRSIPQRCPQCETLKGWHVTKQRAYQMSKQQLINALMTIQHFHKSSVYCYCNEIKENNNKEKRD